MSKLKLAKIVYGCNNGPIRVRIEQLFTKTSKLHRYNIRRTINDDFFHTKNLLAIGQNQYNRLWKNVPSKIETLRLSSFKKENLVEKVFYFVERSVNNI